MKHKVNFIVFNKKIQFINLRAYFFLYFERFKLFMIQLFLKSQRAYIHASQ